MIFGVFWAREVSFLFQGADPLLVPTEILHGHLHLEKAEIKNVFKDKGR
ncbi:hypothetical protein J2Z49_002960 [Desulfofundulus luciae]|uniref:Uncharacterized protein n=1 Tax=Desulfofundulus luciae TaxID=74702 RepID=A0ABU0B6F0_9FIRM|nr:hypothetical protein [Desulfofundulus luciae]